MLQTTDGGGTYTVRRNGAGSEIAYNRIYSIHTGGFGGVGIFLDDDSSQLHRPPQRHLGREHRHQAELQLQGRADLQQHVRRYSIQLPKTGAPTTGPARC